MCWCEQISPLAHSSQATWQLFNLSHCIEMHNTHLLGRAGQLSQAYFTHRAPILTPRNLPPTVNKQWPPLRESRMSRHTRFNTSRKNGNCRDERYIFWYECSLQVDTTIGPNPILYFYCFENVEILVIWNAIREFVTEKLIQLWWNAASQASPRMREDISVSCQVATQFGWFQHRIHRVLPCTTCDLTVLLHNY